MILKPLMMAVFVFDIKVIHLKKNKNMLKNYVKLIVAIVFVSNVMYPPDQPHLA